jgi:hypothetical protein
MAQGVDADWRMVCRPMAQGVDADWRRAQAHGAGQEAA